MPILHRNDPIVVMAKCRIFRIDRLGIPAKVGCMPNMSQCEERRPVFLLAAAADVHPATAERAMKGERVSRKTRAALAAAKSSLPDIMRELSEAVERATAMNGGAS